jgi:RimJ/RimL family protein N-acetyltransferase
MEEAPTNQGFQLQTGRLILRPFTMDDVKAVMEITSSPVVSRYTGDMIYDTPAKAAQWVQMLQNVWDPLPPFLVMAVVPKQTGRPIGYIGLHPKEALDNEVEILYAMADEYQNNGYITEAGEAIIRWCFANTKVPYLVAVVKHSNAPSIRVAQKLGFLYAGERTYPYNGEMTDFHYYRLFSNKESEGTICP